MPYGLISLVHQKDYYKTIAMGITNYCHCIIIVSCVLCLWIKALKNVVIQTQLLAIYIVFKTRTAVSWNTTFILIKIQLALHSWFIDSYRQYTKHVRHLGFATIYQWVNIIKCTVNLTLIQTILIPYTSITFKLWSRKTTIRLLWTQTVIFSIWS